MKKSLTRIFIRSLIVMIPSVSFSQADDDCTFSQLGLLQQIERIAKEQSGASIDTENLRVTWPIGNGGVEYYSTGGCYDLGSTVGRVTEMTEKRSTAAMSTVVLELAHKYLPSEEIERISDALENRSFDSWTNESKDFIAIAHPFGEIYISHWFAEGSDTVEVSWPVL